MSLHHQCTRRANKKQSLGNILAGELWSIDNKFGVWVWTHPHRLFRKTIYFGPCMEGGGALPAQIFTHARE